MTLSYQSYSANVGVLVGYVVLEITLSVAILYLAHSIRLSKSIQSINRIQMLCWRNWGSGEPPYMLCWRNEGSRKHLYMLCWRNGSLGEPPYLLCYRCGSYDLLA
ncbi:hypothetical protein V6N11_054748 [Hibiscus sabdariffa]|uniref:Uncharacterized protein n=1 Tax=Hibiscus sabdariffa TaxID=183260 RepID=A0ABR2S5C0_9ROSI